jgi:hypothetical protein
MEVHIAASEVKKVLSSRGIDFAVEYLLSSR